jgi:dimethylargininase
MIAFTHIPSPQMEQGERTHIARVPIDFERTFRQHAEYCRMLARLGAKVRTLEMNRDLPDCVFIEDTAVVLDELAILASMGAESRRAEPSGIEPILRQYREVRRLESPATLEGGDVVQAGRTILVGLSSRTNPAGVQALSDIVAQFGYRVIPVSVSACLHLKTACTALPDDSLLVNPDLLDMNALVGFNFIRVPKEEPLSADTLTVGQTVCVTSQHPQTAKLIRSHGFEVESVDLSEFAKAEGGITCLSLLLNEL